MTAYERAINRLNHWGMLLAGRIAGTMASDDPRCKGYRDLFQKLLVLRAETTAITSVLIVKGLVTPEELTAAMTHEALLLDQTYEEKYPGVRSTDDGLEFYDTKKAAEWLQGWPQ